MLGVDHFSLEILTKIATNFGKDFEGNVIDFHFGGTPLRAQMDFLTQK